ncbi:MAG: ComEA family DNA-binding protein [Acidimicrobiia bacterium]|nr:ComEA family DNA-binding protein [Acidimicrobiia bacterium]
MPPRPVMASGLDALRDRIDQWRADARFGVIALVVVAVVAGVIWYRVGVSGGESGTSTRPSAAAARTTPSTAVTSTTQRSVGIVVHVAGAVARPGVVELPSGSRVIDAVEAAGGGLPDADLDRLNLAAKIVDGERVLVPKVGEVTNALPDPVTGEPSATSDAVVNLNTATAAQLEELPGIGPVLAAAILDERESRGGFRSVNELRDVRGIGEKRFADLRDRVSV